MLKLNNSNRGHQIIRREIMSVIQLPSGMVITRKNVIENMSTY